MHEWSLLLRHSRRGPLRRCYYDYDRLLVSVDRQVLTDLVDPSATRTFRSQSPGNDQWLRKLLMTSELAVNDKIYRSNIRFTLIRG